jgi:hypothetical protein
MDRPAASAGAEQYQYAPAGSMPKCAIPWSGELEHFPPKWTPVRRQKMRQRVNLERIPSVLYPRLRQFERNAL